MADDADFSTDATPTLQQLATFLADELYSVDRLKRVENLHRNAHAQGATTAHAAQVAAVADLANDAVAAAAKVEDTARGGLAFVLAHVVAHLLGIEVPADALRGAFSGGSESVVGKAIGTTVMGGIAGSGAPLEPTDEGAIRLMGMLSQLELTSWFEGVVTQYAESLGGILHPINAIGELGHDLVDALGLGRLARVALAPAVRTTITVPLDWKFQKQYRPKLLAEADIMRAFLRGDYSAVDAAEELSRLGYSDARQDALLKNNIKYLSADDALVLVRAGVVDRQFALDNMRGQGFDAVGAENAVLVAETKRLDSIHDDSIGAIKTAYVDRRITDADLQNYLPAVYPSAEDQAAHEVALRTMRDLNTKRLTAAQAEACVKAKVLAIADYRNALQLEGYDDNSVLALELLLETELNAKADVEALRAQKLAEAAAAKQAKADAAAAKQAAIEQQRAIAQLGPLSELVRAAVRGLIPISRVTEKLSAQYPADTVQIYVDDITQQRAAYVAQQQKAADALKNAAVRHIDVGALQTAVLENVLTLQQFTQELTTLKFDPADVQILTDTLQARKADLDAAKRKQADAALKAKTKTIDLGRLEQLVRDGHRTMADYTALLTSLGYDDASVAAMVDLLTVKVADDKKAAATRAAIAAANAAKGLSLEQARRSVILGVQTVNDFQRYLIANKFTVEAQSVLLAELRDDVTKAEAARAKRAASAPTKVETRLPLATVERAARLGIVTPDVYSQRLVDAGYTPDDVAIDLDLLAVEIADVQAARARAAAAEAKTTDRGLSLQQLATAVKLGDASIDDYRARAIELGYASDDVDTLVSVLSDEVQTVQAAQARHTAIAGQLTARNLSLSELDAAVKAGQMTIDAYTARLVALGFGTDDADLLTTLLELKLPPPAAGG